MNESIILKILLGLSLLGNILIFLDSSRIKNSTQLEQTKLDKLVRQNEENVKLLQEIQDMNQQYKLQIEEQKIQIQNLQQKKSTQ